MVGLGEPGEQDAATCIDFAVGIAFAAVGPFFLFAPIYYGSYSYIYSDAMMNGPTLQWIMFLFGPKAPKIDRKEDLKLRCPGYNKEPCTRPCLIPFHSTLLL